MHKIFLYTLIAGLCSVNISTGANLYSIANGSWSTAGTWSYTPGGASCGCSPIASDNVTINHTVQMDKNLTNMGGSNLNGITGILTINVTGSLLGGNTYDIDIRSTGSLYLCGSLTARNVIFSNGSIVNVCSTGNLAVNGDFSNKNNSNSVTINGNMTVTGGYENGNGGVISGTGTISVTNGPIINTGSTFGCEGYNPCNNVFPCQINSPCLAPLPVSLLELKATWLEPNVVNVNWLTSSEVNNHYFDVLRSENGVDFTFAGRLPGHGTSSQTHSYSFADTELPPVHFLYYRLRQVDYDGQSTLSKIVAVSRKSGIFQVRVFPNPFHSFDGQSLSVMLENAVHDLQFEITDPEGRLVFSQSFHNPENFSVVQLPVHRLSAGMYMFRVRHGDQEYVTKLVAWN